LRFNQLFRVLRSLSSWARALVQNVNGVNVQRDFGPIRLFWSRSAFVDLGLTLAPGTTQIVAYVVSGVGFLGAGAIMKDGGNVRGLNTAAKLWCSAAVGACAGAGEMFDAVFVAALLIVINSVLRPLSRYIDRRSLARLDRRVFYRLRLFCDTDHQTDAEYEVTRAIAFHALVLRELRTEKVEGGENSVVQAVWNRVQTTAR